LIRTIWLASIFLATLGGLLATKIVSANVSETADAVTEATEVADPAIAEASPAPDTLTDADRIALTYLLAPAESAPLVPMAPATAQQELDAPRRIAIVGQAVPGATTVAVMLPRPRPKIKQPAKNGTERSKAVASDAKTCRQDPIARFLTSANIGTRCET
jgi:hypothetical protein